MPGLILWKNQHINRLKKDIDTMFDRVCGEYGIASSHRIIKKTASFELSDTGISLILIAVLPDVDPESMELALTGDHVTISGKIYREIIKEGSNLFRTFDSLIRTIKLPCYIQINEVEAVYEKGILKVIMPKCPPEKTRIIKISKIMSGCGD
jgi:HSP20 family protein